MTLFNKDPIHGLLFVFKQKKLKSSFKFNTKKIRFFFKFIYLYFFYMNKTQWNTNRYFAELLKIIFKN